MATPAQKWTKFVFATDLHGDKLHLPTVTRLLKFLDDYKPGILIFGGDLMDLRPLRRGAGTEDKRESMREDVEAGLKFLDSFFNRPADQKWFHHGNHDKRLVDIALESSGPISDHAANGVNDLRDRFKRMNVKDLPYHKRNGILKIGHLQTLHGYFHGVNAARQHAATYGCCLFGHTHTIDEIPIPGVERRVARGAGCLCELDMEYNATMPSTLRHAHGWIYGSINMRTGVYFCQQAEEVNGQWNIDALK